MNKVICNICGTSYPENAQQCPICGFARSAESIEADIDGNHNEYQHIRGGRFSKSNVKKRNHKQKKTAKKEVVAIEAVPPAAKEKSSIWTALIIVILLLAIIAVVGYIALRFFLPNDFVYEGLDSIKQQLSSLRETEPEEEQTEPSTTSDCSKITLDKYTIDFDGISSIYNLNVSVEPAHTPDVITYVSSDEAVCTVSETGMITSVGEGTAVITVTCGQITAQCTVNCSNEAAKPKLELSRKEIAFTEAGDSVSIYDGKIPVEEITWTSEDEKVAKVSKGKVTAVGNGETTIFATAGDQTVSCLVRCEIDDTKYSLYNPHGYADDVTIKVGQTFTLKLVDEDKNAVENATWSVNKKSVCSYSGSTVKALAAGTAKITAEYKGKEYTCIVRVVK